MEDNKDIQNKHIPKVSIGMPVYNGGRFIRKALDSLLAQTFTDFELIISDNASTDATQEICMEYAARDNRIGYIRQPINMGGFLNFKFVLEQAKGEYFKWCAADDYIGSADYLSEMVVAIEQGFECAFSDTDVVSSNGQQQTYLARGIMSVFSSCYDAVSFSRAALKIPSHQFYGLFRKKALTRYYSYLEVSSHLRCFGEGLFVHAISEKLKLVYVANVKYVYRRHRNNISSIQPARILLLDFMKYTMQLYRYYICESKYKLSARLHFLVKISVGHGRYAFRLFLSTVKQLVLTLNKYIRFTHH